LVGVGAGLAVAHYALKIKMPVGLMAAGVAGGLAGHYGSSYMVPKVKEVEAAVETEVYDMENGEAELDDMENGEAASSMSGERIAFNPTVGYPTPSGVITEEYPSEFWDIDA